MKKIITSSCGKYNATVELEVKVQETNSNILELNIASDVFGQTIYDKITFLAEEKERFLGEVINFEVRVKEKLDFLVKKQTLQRRDEIIKSLSKLNYV